MLARLCLGPFFFGVATATPAAVDIYPPSLLSLFEADPLRPVTRPAFDAGGWRKTADPDTGKQ